MKTSKFAVIKAKFSSSLYGGGYCKKGEWIVMFPRNIFIAKDENGNKTFQNSYVRLNDLHKFPEFAEVRSAITKKYKINPDTYGQLKTTYRGWNPTTYCYG